MPYCKKCGAELPEYAVFCSKCGVKYPVSAAPEDEITETSQVQNTQPVQPTAPQTTPPPQTAAVQTENNKPSVNVSGWFKNNAMSLYVILGIVTIALIQLSSTVISLSPGLSITFAVFAIICSVFFCVIGVVKYVVCAHPTDGKKHSTGDVICLALGIIAFVYVLISAIAVIDAANELRKAMDMLGSLGM